MTVIGTPFVLPLPSVGNSPAWRHTNWGRARLEGVPLLAGAANTIELSNDDGWSNISIDEVTVSTAAELAAAAPHCVVLALSVADREALLAFLLQLDGSPEPNLSGLIFADGFESGNASSW